MDAIILSGRHRQVELRLGHPTKSMIKYDEDTALDSVIKEVVASDHIDSAVVIGPEEARSIVEHWDKNPKPVFWVLNPDGYSMFQNLMHAYHHLLRVCGSSHEAEIFFACSDIPFLTSYTVSDFIGKYSHSGLTAVVPIVSLTSCQDLERSLGVKVPSIGDHMPIALDGELYHLGNMGLLRPDKLSPYWFKTLCLSRDARQITGAMQAISDPKRIKLVFHLFFGFLRQNDSKDVRQFLKFANQLLNWVASSHYFKYGNEDKAREYSSKVSSLFLLKEFFPSFGLRVEFIRYDRPEVFIDFDTLVDVDFLSNHYGALKAYFNYTHTREYYYPQYLDSG